MLTKPPLDNEEYSIVIWNGQIMIEANDDTKPCGICLDKNCSQCKEVFCG